MKQIYFSFKLLIFSTSLSNVLKVQAWVSPCCEFSMIFFLQPRENVWDGVFYLQPPESHSLWFASSMKFILLWFLFYERSAPVRLPRAGPWNLFPEFFLSSPWKQKFAGFEKLPHSKIQFWYSISLGL